MSNLHNRETDHRLRAEVTAGIGQTWAAASGDSVALSDERRYCE